MRRRNRQKMSVHPGEVYAFERFSGGYGFIRIVLDIEQQCKRTSLIDDDSSLRGFEFFGEVVIVDLFRNTAETSELPKKDLSVLVKGLAMSREPFEFGYYPKVGFHSVSPMEIEFPENLSVYNDDSVIFHRGEIKKRIPFPSQELDSLRVYPGLLSDIEFDLAIAYYTENEESVKRITSHYKGVEPEGLTHQDLRYADPKARSKVYAALNEDASMSYFDLAMKHGFDVRRFYDLDVVMPAPPDAQDLLLCAYCLTPRQEGDRFCKNCGGDAAKDAAVEMSRQEYLSGKRVFCPHCGQSILDAALYCFACRKRRRDGRLLIP